MEPIKVNNMIIDEGFEMEEAVTVYITHNNKDYSITFNKADLELINSWVFEEETSLPANLPDNIIDSIREDIKKRI
ncbi:hypothetical protein [Alkalihalobacillus sp. BA299]|uniref:hypothetical protein n=1 Tax=Alkalihalobacillus sp. BA299 TaxID=2815938 RepID=UPI001ADC4A13|nr:hypothetical protein [Alkalihalobacillus sp. BA299]